MKVGEWKENSEQSLKERTSQGGGSLLDNKGSKKNQAIHPELEILSGDTFLQGGRRRLRRSHEQKQIA